MYLAMATLVISISLLCMAFYESTFKIKDELYLFKLKQRKLIWQISSFVLLKYLAEK